MEMRGMNERWKSAWPGFGCASPASPQRPGLVLSMGMGFMSWRSSQVISSLNYSTIPGLCWGRFGHIFFSQRVTRDLLCHPTGELH